MDYKKIIKIIIAVFLILGNFITIFPTITWQINKNKYDKEYVYSDVGDLYYEKDSEKIYIEQLYDTDGETIQVDVPDKKTIIVYCYKDNPTKGIYLGINNTLDTGLQNPIVNICISVLMLTVAIYILSKHPKNPIYDFWLFCVFLFILGIVISIYQGIFIVKYYNLKGNDIVDATIYSDIYITGVRDGKYKAVSYYYVNDKKYVYVDEFYKDGNINDVLGTTQKLYYNSNNPSEASSKINVLTFIIFIIGIFLIIFNFPFVFFKDKMAARYDKALKNRI